MSNLTSAPTHGPSVSELTTEGLLLLLKEKRVQIEARGGRLKISAPAGSVDAALKAELKLRKAALLAALAHAAADAPGSAGLVALSADGQRGRVPLTPAQQGLWLIDHFDPGNVAYNIPEAFLYEGTIALETVQSAVDKLIERHGILRTSFHEEDGELFQSISSTVEGTVGSSDLSALSEAESERRCRESVRTQMLLAFDLKQAPLVRFHLFRLAERRHVVFLNIHHIIADRTSLYVLREELVALIDAVQSGRDAELPPLQYQFADYAAWLSAEMRSDMIVAQMAYWKKKLEGVRSIELPHSRPRPERRSPLGAKRRVVVPASARSVLEGIGTEEGASPFMMFLAVFAVSLARWSRSAENATGPVDFCIGSPITHRKDAATQRMVGPFMNMLAFRCEIRPGMGFREVVRQVRGTALEAYENSDVPFQRLVGALNPDRRSRRSPIFQVMLGYETYMAPVANEFPLDAVPGAARYDLSLHIWETADGGLMGNIEYCTDLFEERDIDRLAIEGDAVFAAIVHDPDQDVFGGDVRGGQPTETGTASNLNRSKGRPDDATPAAGAKGGLLSRMAGLLSLGKTGRSKGREVVSVALED